MPWQHTYVPPQLAFNVLRGNEVFPVYHVYKEQNLTERLSYWYTFDFREDVYPFDVRDLPEFDDADHQRTVQTAIDNGTHIITPTYEFTRHL
jgi:hypothetical protein